MPDKVWDKAEFLKYVNNGGFTAEFQRDTLYAQAKKSELIDAVIKLKKGTIVASVLDTIEGRTMVSEIVEMAQNEMQCIISCSVDGFEKNKDEIKNAALKIKVAYEFMYWMLGLIAKIEDGKEDHETRMRKE